MPSLGVSSGKRPGTAYAAAAAAKVRRQRITAACLGVVLLAVLAYEVPKLLKSLSGSSTTVVSAPPPVTHPPVSSSAANLLKRLRHARASDPFAEKLPTYGDPTPRDVATPAGSIDPFARSLASRAPAESTAPPAAGSPLPQKIVIGKPGGGRKATHGWIVILASIPTGEGRSSATAFASRARKNGLAPVSVLNSSNRRPLRGGYWVVYTGPYSTLNGVTSRAGSIHTNGYPTAYIRELIVYR